MPDSDLEVLRQIVQARGGFGHEEHLELAWSYLARYDLERAQQATASAIQHLAGLHGASSKYHDTITRTWVHLVAVHRARSDATSFEDFLAENQGLLDRRLLAGHFSRELIGSPEARAGWTEPDLRDLPTVA
jgi:hypothetical protein